MENLIPLTLGIGPASIGLIAVVALMRLRTEEVAEFGRAAGQTLKEFKNATNGIMDDDKRTNRKRSD